MKEVRKNKLEQFNYSIFMDWFKKNQNPLKWELKNKLIELRSEFDPLNIIEYEIFVSFNFQKTKQDIKRKINLIWELAYQMDFKILTSELNEIMKVAKEKLIIYKIILYFGYSK